MSAETDNTGVHRPGDRIVARDRPWRVRKALDLGGAVALEVEALDEDEPRNLTLVSPPDRVDGLPPAELTFHPQAFEALEPWLRAHRFLSTSLVRPPDSFSGAQLGRVTLESYQLLPVARALASPRPSLLIADDVGLGKTVEAGLLMLELLARRRADRILVVAPAGLLLQWKEELAQRVGLEFEALENAAGVARAQTSLPAGLSPWDALPRVLTSIDFLKKETVRRRALRRRWDLVVVDEAHALAVAGTPANPYITRRTRLGVELRKATRGLVLLTATPHNGYHHSFRSLLELVEPTMATLHGGREAVARRVSSVMVRRMKAQIVRRLPDGGVEPVFPLRSVKEIPIALSSREAELFGKLSAYCSRTARTAEAEDRDLVGFAMQIIKKRALSSRIALEATLDHRLKVLTAKENDEPAPEAAEIRDLMASLPMDEAAAIRTAQRIVAAAVPRDEKRRRAEAKTIRSLHRQIRSLGGNDPKIVGLLEELRDIRSSGEKVIVFTEYLDTLNAIRQAIDADEALSGCTTVLRGGMSARLRKRVQAEFEGDTASVLLATDAASEGLNLQRACRRVVHFELPWNPNRLEQRNGRVDRYGQTRPPIVKYLFFPDTAEERVLHRLVEKIEEMRRDRVVPPDILGVLEGDGALARGLVALDPDSVSVSAEAEEIVGAFEVRASEFRSDLLPLLEAGSVREDEVAAHATMPSYDEVRLEEDVLAVLSGAAHPAGVEGTWRLAVPPRLRGPSVSEHYSAVTFRRAIAVSTRAEDVEFVTSRHPLLGVLAQEARRRFLQAFPEERALRARRLAARSAPIGDTVPSAIVTFLATVMAGDGLLEESLLPVWIGLDGEEIRSSQEAVDLLDAAGTERFNPRLDDVSRLFSGAFTRILEGATRAAERAFALRVTALERSRGEKARGLLRDLEIDTADRLAEIEEEERRAREGPADSNQLQLFVSSMPTSRFATRRDAVRQQVDARQKEIGVFSNVFAAGPPSILGALFLVPERS